MSLSLCSLSFPELEVKTSLCIASARKYLNPDPVPAFAFFYLIMATLLVVFTSLHVCACQPFRMPHPCSYRLRLYTISTVQSIDHACFFRTCGSQLTYSNFAPAIFSVVWTLGYRVLRVRIGGHDHVSDCSTSLQAGQTA